MHMTSGEPEQLIVLPRPTYLPLFTALATGAAALAMLFQFYLLSLAAALLTAGLFVLAGQRAGLGRDYGPLAGRSWRQPATAYRGGRLAAVVALIFTLVADGTCSRPWCSGRSICGSRRRTGRRRRRPSRASRSPSATLAALAIAAAAARGSLRAVAAGGVRARLDRLCHAGARCRHRRRRGAYRRRRAAPREHALGATAAALIGYLALHAGIGLLFLISNLLRMGAGLVSPRRSTRPAPDAALARLHSRDGSHRARSRPGAAGLVAMLGARP